jgi:FKBP-type peptidyl-prolyl cis-trans isomerase
MIAHTTVHRTILAGLMCIFLPSVVQGGQQTAPAAVQGDPALKNEHEKLSYALGVDFANQLRSYSVDVDLDLLMRGLRDARSSGQALLTEAEVRAAVNDLRNGLMKKQIALQNAKLAESKKGEEAFLAENKSKEGVVTLESGLQYKILKAGDGKKPTIGDTVICHFRGINIDGTEFANSYNAKGPATFALGKVIKGWAEALQLMPVGSKWQLFIPSNLAYGERGVSRRVAPNATVIFEVELVAIQETTAKVSPTSNTVKPASSHDKAVSTSTALTAIKVSFKLDPQLTQGLYMGERWVSPPRYNGARAGKSITVDARADGLDAKGSTRNITPKWIPADPAMVTVTPSEGNAVAITVHHAGQSTLQVTAGGISKELDIKAEYLGQIIQVEIGQK